MRNLILIFALAFAAYAQTELSDKTFKGAVDASAATTTAPAKAGTSLPGTCTVGQQYFKTDATAGQNLYYCTATNTWTQQLNSGGSGGSVFTGSTASTVASSATPAFSLADVSVKSPIRFNISPVVNVTGPTITNKTAGAHFYIAVTTDGTHTWTWNSIVSDNVCTIYTAAAATTVAEITVDPDGSTLHGGTCVGGPAGLLTLGPTGSACAANPASGQLCVGLDTTDNNVKVRDSSGNFYEPVKTGADINPLTGAVNKVNGNTPGGTCTNQFPRSLDSSGRPTCASIVQADLPASTLATGTSVSLTAPRQYYVCTGTCTVTPPVPAAGYEFCVRNANNVTTVITLAALGSSARYENTANTAYGTASTGTLVSGGAAGDKVCIVGLDSTHYLTISFAGTWTAN